MFEYDLPEELVAQYPPARRSDSRLMVVDRRSGRISDAVFNELGDILRPGDTLVLNDSRVFPARLLTRRATGGRVELLLLELPHSGRARSMYKAARPLREGQQLLLENGGSVSVVGPVQSGRCVVDFGDGDAARIVEANGHVPLPPYIKRPAVADDKERYQTVYAHRQGSVAAPTAGLHFARGMLAELGDRGIGRCSLTLHVGPATFLPLRNDLGDPVAPEEEWYEVGEEAVSAVRRCRSDGGRVVAVGTTSVRTMETVADGERGLRRGSGTTGLFISPGYQFEVVDALLTNFHLPGTSLLQLVAAFAGRELAAHAYNEAVRRRYRFYSYGDAMLVL